VQIYEGDGLGMFRICELARRLDAEGDGRRQADL